MTKEQLHQEITRLESENKVLKQIIQETQKALSNVYNFVDLTILDTVPSPYNTNTEHTGSVFGKNCV